MDSFRQEKVQRFEEFVHRRLKPDLVKAIAERYVFVRSFLSYVSWKVLLKIISTCLLIRVKQCHLVGVETCLNGCNIYCKEHIILSFEGFFFPRLHICLLTSPRLKLDILTQSFELVQFGLLWFQNSQLFCKSK